MADTLCPPIFFHFFSKQALVPVKNILFLLIVLLFANQQVAAQKQLVLLRGQDVLLRLHPGDEFIYRLKGSKSIKKTYVNNLFDGYVITHHDTVPFYKIDRIYMKRTMRINTLGSALVVGSAMLFTIDQLNQSVLHGNDFSLDRGISTACLIGLGAGLPMMIIRKKSQKLNYKYQLLTVKKGSAFYLPDPRGFSSPFLDN
jgi:hypothetical protein